ncbi:MAG: cheY [Myxococcaceae bacterium]|nr:cheY [Myxococcaceae bacterium]
MQQPLILVVEDDEEVREAVCDLLCDAEYEVLTAGNGEEALSQLRAHRNIRAIVLDVTMPVMNGATFRGQQLADESIADIPLVVLTGREDSSLIANALGASACLRKPVSGDDLLRALARYR